MAEQIGSRSTEEMEALLADGKNSFNFASPDGSCFYQVVKFENEYPYNITVCYNGPRGKFTQAYEESYYKLQNLIDHEPFDLSKFIVEPYRSED